MLDCAKGGYLLKSDEELTANIAIDRRGALYLCEAAVVSFILTFVNGYMTLITFIQEKQGDSTSKSISPASTSAATSATTSGIKRTKVRQFIAVEVSSMPKGGGITY